MGRLTVLPAETVWAYVLRATPVVSAKLTVFTVQPCTKYSGSSNTRHLDDVMLLFLDALRQTIPTQAKPGNASIVNDALAPDQTR